MTPNPEPEQQIDPEELERQRAEAEIRGQLISGSVRRHAWINIAGPLAALILGFIFAEFYLHPIKTLRWIQTTQLGWSGVALNEAGLDDGLMTYFMNGGYQGMEPVILIHGLG